MKNFIPSAIKDITPEIVDKVSNELKLNLSKDETTSYAQIINSLFPKFSEIYLKEETLLIAPFPRIIKQNHQNPLNAFSSQCDLKGSEDGCLKNKKIVVKDTVMISGLPLSNGSHLLEGFIASEDATIIQRILKAGGIIVGKSKCEDLCLSANNFTCFNGQVCNPINDQITTGGSSSGSAALVSAGLVDIGVAGDQGGSIRIPAASCRVIGFKPTFGLIPCTGIIGIEYTFDHVGPISKETKDIALFMDATAGPDENDHRYYTYLRFSTFSIDNLQEKKQKNEWEIKENLYYGVSKINVSYLKAWENYEKLLKGIDSNKLRIGIWKNSNLPGELAQSFWKRVPNMKQTFSLTYGLNVEEFLTDDFEIFSDLFFLLILLGFYDFLLSNDHSTSNSFDKYNTFLTKFTHMSKETNIKDVSHTIKIFLTAAHYIKENYGNKFYVKGSNLRKELTEKFMKTFENYDLILMPTFVDSPPKLTKERVNIAGFFGDAFKNCNLTSIFNVLGYPVMTIDLDRNNKFGTSLCPMMIIGKHFEDHRVIQFGRFIEKLTENSEHLFE